MCQAENLAKTLKFLDFFAKNYKVFLKMPIIVK